jgi:nucleoside-diphosphate-sugar epimerase
MNVLITGASGFVGADLTKKLVDEGHEVFALVRDAKKLAKAVGPDYLRRIQVLEGDLLANGDLEKIAQQLKSWSVSLDIVVDLAGGGPLTANNKEHSFATNYQTTVNLMQVLENSNKLNSLSLFVYFSSLAAMGLPDGSGDRIHYDESTTCNPKLPLERGKFDSETFLKNYAEKCGFKVACLRFPQIYGLADSAFRQIVSLMRKGVFPVVRGRIGSLPLIHLRDCVGATFAVICNAHRMQNNFDVYLVCESSCSYNRLLELIQRKYGQGGLMRVPYFVMYLGTSVVQRLFGFLGKPEPLNTRRLVSLTKDRTVDSGKFMRTFQFQFQESVEGFIANELP